MRAQYARGAMLACVGAALGGGCVDLDSLVGHGDAGAPEAGSEGSVSDTDAAKVDGGADVGVSEGAVVDGQGSDATNPGDAKSDGTTPKDTGPAGLPWWNTEYTSREELTVTNNAVAAMSAGFQLGWPVDVEALASASGSYDEVRLVRWDAGSSSWTELTRVIDELGAHQEWLWARLATAIGPATSDGSYYLYFGNASPPASPNDPATVFDFYDPLSEATLGASWSTQGPHTMTGTELRLDTDGYAITTATYGAEHAVDFVVRDPVYAGRYWAGFQLPATFTDDSPWMVWIARNAASPAAIWPEITLDGTTIWMGSTVTVPTSAVLYGVDWLGDRALYRVSDVVESTGTPASPYTDPLCVRLTNESGNPVYFSDVRVRQATYPTPTVTVGPIEPQ